MMNWWAAYVLLFFRIKFCDVITPQKASVLGVLKGQAAICCDSKVILHKEWAFWFVIKLHISLKCRFSAFYSMVFLNILDSLCKSYNI